MLKDFIVTKPRLLESPSCISVHSISTYTSFNILSTNQFFCILSSALYCQLCCLFLPADLHMFSSGWFSHSCHMSSYIPSICGIMQFSTIPAFSMIFFLIPFTLIHLAFVYLQFLLHAISSKSLFSKISVCDLLASTLFAHSRAPLLNIWQYFYIWFYYFTVHNVIVYATYELFFQGSIIFFMGAYCCLQSHPPHQFLCCFTVISL